MKDSKKYAKTVKWSYEDNCYIGTCSVLMSGGIHGDDEVKVYKELCQAVEEVIQIYKEDKKPLPENYIEFGEVHKKACDVLGEEYVDHWLTELNFALNRKSPISLCNTNEGRVKVMDLLNNIEYGMPL